ncbi:hypothetical protein KKC13_00455 [bacterium]|nr:hypothetical protein [bacterium]MBU1957228.1 hypothetical protein [bacterium]
MKASDIMFELNSHYVNEKVIKHIIKDVNTHGFNAQKIDEILVKLGYDEIFTNSDDINYQEYYTEKISHRRKQLADE